MKHQKERIIKAVVQRKNQLAKLSKDIHRNPERGFEEFKAVGFITELLREQDIDVEENYCGLPTSFRAVKKGKGPGPKITFLAEYDAVPELGHSGGNNITAACATGAFLGLASVIRDYAGEVSLIGTPAGIKGGGKIALLESGGFEDTDFAMLIHPAGKNENLLDRGGTASSIVTVMFHGKSSHASLPSNGLNAFTASIHMFNQIDQLRIAFEEKDRINGVILEGGNTADIIPERVICELCVRGKDKRRVEELVEQVTDCVARAAELTKTRCSVKSGPICAEKYANLPICEAFKDNMSELGVSMSYADTNRFYESSDIGNVSIEIPSVHGFLGITDKPDIYTYSQEYRKEAISKKAQEVAMIGAIGMAMTGLDLLEDNKLRIAAKVFHQKQVPENYKVERKVKKETRKAVVTV